MFVYGNGPPQGNIEQLIDVANKDDSSWIQRIGKKQSVEQTADNHPGGEPDWPGLVPGPGQQT